MHSRLWYDIGIAFPAWRTVVKGLKSGWFESADSRESDVDHYGDIDDNYMYFNKLESNISRMAILQPYVVVRQLNITDLILSHNNFAFF